MHSQQDFAERNEKNALPRRIISVSTKERAFADDTKNTKMATNQMQDGDVLDTLLHADPLQEAPVLGHLRVLVDQRHELVVLDAHDALLVACSLLARRYCEL